MDSFSGKIASILLKRNALAQDKLAQALEEIQESGDRLEECLLRNGMVSHIDYTLALSEYVGLPPISLESFVPNHILMEALPKDFWRTHKALPLARVAKTMTVALSDPT